MHYLWKYSCQRALFATMKFRLLIELGLAIAYTISVVIASVIGWKEVTHVLVAEPKSFGSKQDGIQMVFN